jgi:tetratricopeptide (TPR) repeat protein
LDYYISGVKIDPSHFGCIYNVGCCHFYNGKFANSKKWFDLAIKVDKTSLDSHFGRTAACLKLGLYTEALQSISKIDQTNWTGKFDEATGMCNGSTNYKWYQVVYLHATCLKIIGKYEKAYTRYNALDDIRYTKVCEGLKDLTASLILLPLMHSREKIEDGLTDFIEL